MSDKELRELERTFRESGSIQDEVAWLHKRLKIGYQDPHNLEVAAMLGHPAAKELFHWVEPLNVFDSGFALTGITICTRTVMIAANLAYQLACKNFDEDAPLQAIRASLAYLKTPYSDERKSELQNTLAPALEASDHLMDLEADDILIEAVKIPYSAASWVLGDYHFKISAWENSDGIRVYNPTLKEGLAPRITNELIPWLLGGEDPLQIMYRSYFHLKESKKEE